MISGSTGLVGSRIIELLKDDFNFIQLLAKDVDITDSQKVGNFINEKDFDIFLHLAAYTNVNGAEIEKDLAYKINVDGTKNVFDSVINKDKKHKDNILLINASKLFKKGRPKNYLPDEYVDKISSLYLKWKEEEGISKVIEKEEIVKNDYNLSPSRYVAQNGEDETLPLDEAVVLVKEAEEERAKADEKLRYVLEQLGFE